jgi:hypothetical protein
VVESTRPLSEPSTTEAGNAGDVDHAYANHGDEPARFSLAVYEPGVGAAPVRGHHA